MKSPTSWWTKVVFAFGAILVSSCLTSMYASDATWQTLWTIGTFNKSSGEFHDGPAPEGAPPYVIAKSQPAEDWYAFQPGTGNGSFGHRAHPVSIQFDLPEKPAGAYQMKIALLVEHPGISALQVEINGHSGRFYQHPKLDYTAGDIQGCFFPEYSDDTITFEFPGSFLHQGENKITLTAIDEAQPGDQTSIEGTPAGDSGVTYDALELDQQSGGRFDAKRIVVLVEPTIYYRTEDGQLKEMVDVFTRYGEQPRSGEVKLELGGKTLTQSLPTDRAFGECKTEFAVPEFSGSTNGEVTVSLNGRQQRFPQELTPGKKWTFFVVPNEHLDVGYTDYQAKVAEVHARVIDETMELIKKHPDFTFSLDSYWEVQQFLDGRTQSDKDEFYRMVENRKIFVPAQYASLLTGFPAAETLIRSLYPSYLFSRKHNGPFDYANITDVPSYSWSYASVMAAAGLKYFIAASDNYRGPVLLLGRLNEKTPFWWEGPDGSKILMWYSRHYHQVLTLFGMPPQIAAGHDALPVFLQMYEHPGYKSDAVILYGAQPENTDLFPQQAALAEDWNKIYSYPKLTFSGFSDAMSDIAKQFGDSIPTVRGDGGPYWEDGITSDAFYAALERENESRAVLAEKLATVSTLVNPRASVEKNLIGRMWDNMLLMDEHTWESAVSLIAPHNQQSVQQRAVKDMRAQEANFLVNHVLERGMAAIVDSIYDPSGSVVVFNPLNWKRNGLVEFDLLDSMELVDKTTHQPVPYEVLRSEDHYRHIRFVATDVPSMGYKAYELKATTAKTPAAETLSGTTLESPYYRVELDPQTGAVRSIYDKQLNKELVDTSSPYRFDQYVYVTGADKMPNRLVQYRAISPVPELTPHPAGEGRLISVTRTPYGTEALLESTGYNTPSIQTIILLSDQENKIEFINKVEKKEVFTKEGVYFAFPFAMDHPEFQYEIQNGVVDPAKDMIPGAGLEWFSVQHWAAVQQNGVAAAVLPLDASMMTFGDMAHGTWPTEFGQRKGTIFSYVMNNYWDTNYRAGQGGEFTFRYVVTSATSTDPATLSRLGWEEMTPLELDEITSQDKAVNLPRPLDGAQGSFLEVDQPEVLLDTWKVAEDGHGTILRFLEIGGQSRQVRITTPLLDLQSAWLCNAMEHNEQSLTITAPHSVTFEAKPHQIVTVRIEGTGTLAPPAI